MTFKEIESFFFPDAAMHYLLRTGNLSMKLLGVTKDNISMRVQSRRGVCAVLKERCLGKLRQMPGCSTLTPLPSNLKALV